VHLEGKVERKHIYIAEDVADILTIKEKKYAAHVALENQQSREAINGRILNSNIYYILIIYILIIY